jgi:hypothetical protein
VDQRVGGDVLLARNQRDEQCALRDEEQHAQRPRQEGHDVELAERQRVEQVGDGDADEEERAAEIGRDHHLPAAPAAVDPGARMQREEKVRREVCRRQVAHLRRTRVQDEHAGERHRQLGDLVAEQRDRLPGPVTAEVPILP